MYSQDLRELGFENRCELGIISNVFKVKRFENAITSGTYIEVSDGYKHHNLIIRGVHLPDDIACETVIGTNFLDW